jgi:hypothetical protein
MSSPIAGKINVTNIDKARLFKGAKGTYLDFILMPSDDNQYGNDFMVIQQVTKEERMAGKRGQILGNAKFIGGKSASKTNTTRVLNDPQPTSSDGVAEDVPF